MFWLKAGVNSGAVLNILNDDGESWQCGAVGSLGQTCVDDLVQVGGIVWRHDDVDDMLIRLRCIYNFLCSMLDYISVPHVL